MRDFRALFFDIDGTLLPAYGASVPPSAQAALLALRRRGVKLFIATGRPPHAVRMLRGQLGLDFDGYITLNGQYCADAAWQRFYEKPLPGTAVRALVPWLLEHPRIRCTFAELEYMYTNIPGGDIPIPVDTPARCLTHTTYQISPHVPVEQEAALLAHAPGCRSARWNAQGTDFIPADGGKTVGMDRMLEHFGLAADACMAFGDGLNDLEMLQHAAVGVAMGNGVPEVRRAADYVTADAADDGIAKALAHFGLL